MTNQATEQCDDGNAVETDGCLATCVICGDMMTTAGREQCDDGNPDAHDACTNACTTARCGDGVVQFGVEDCDDGNAVDGDGCPADCQLPVARFVYTSAPADGTVNLYGLANGVGMDARGYQYVGAQAGPVASHPGGRFLYVYAQTGIHSFNADAPATPTHGRIVQIGTPMAVSGVVDLMMDPPGSYLFALRAAGITGYRINQVTGALTEVQTTSGAYSTFALNWSGTFAAATAADGVVTFFAVNRVTGAMTPTGVPVAAGQGPHVLQFDRYGRVLFVLSAGAATVRIYDVTANGLSFATANAVAPSSSAMAVLGDGSLVLTSNGSAGALQSWRVDGSTRALVPAVAGVTGSWRVSRLLPADDGSIVIGLSPATQQLLVFQPNMRTGAVQLTRAAALRGSTNAAAILHGRLPLAVQSGFALVADSVLHQVRAYAVSAADGTLGATAVSQVNGVDSIVLDATQGRAYGWLASTRSLRVLNVNATTGELTLVPTGVTSANALTHLSYDGSGRFIYGLDQTARTIRRYLVDQTTLVPSDAAATATSAVSPNWLKADPVGRRLLAISQESDINGSFFIPRTFDINSQTGAPSAPVAWSATATGDSCSSLDDLVVNPNGANAFAAAFECVWHLTFSTTPTPSAGTVLSEQAYRQRVGVHPQGHLLVTEWEDAQDGFHRLETHDITPEGLVTSRREFDLGGVPKCLTFDPSGRFLYVQQGTQLDGYELRGSPVRYERIWNVPWAAGAGCPMVTSSLQ